MTSVPRSFFEFSEEEVEAEERYAVQKRLDWEPRVEVCAREFYSDVRSPTPDEPFEMTSTVKLDGEQHRCTFDVRLWEVRGSRSLVNWVMPGQVELTYIVDEIEWRKKTIDLRLEARYGAGPVGTFIDDMDDMEEELEWENFLLIFLKFDENTIRYYNPNNPSRVDGPEVVGEVMKRHCEIYASPQASRGCEFDDFGYVLSEEESQENQEPSSCSEADESSASY